MVTIFIAAHHMNLQVRLELLYENLHSLILINTKSHKQEYGQTVAWKDYALIWTEKQMVPSVVGG